jgi:hypothetical protein
VNDPRELRRQIRALDAKATTLEGKLKLLEQARDRAPERVEVPVINGQLDDLKLAIGEASGIATKLVAAGEGFRIGAEALARQLEAVEKPQAQRRAVALAGSAPTPRPAGPPARRSAPAAPPVDGDLRPSGPQQRILDALAALEEIGVPVAAKTQLALFSEASPKSSAYSNNLGALRTAGLIDYPAGGKVALTEAGRSLANAAGAPTTTAELHAYVFGLVGGAKARLLEVLIDVYPETIEKAELAERAGASATSSAFSNNLGSLRSLGLIDYPAGGYVVALPVLFLEEAARA